jgi:hypothetical protein
VVENLRKTKSRKKYFITIACPSFFVLKIENEIFSFSVKVGVIIPKIPKYWK